MAEELAKIGEIYENGELVYPQTVTDAVLYKKDASTPTRPLTNVVKELQEGMPTPQDIQKLESLPTAEQLQEELNTKASVEMLNALKPLIYAGL